MGFVFPLDSEASAQKKKGFDIDLEIGANSTVCENEGRSRAVSCIGKATSYQKVMSSPTDLSRVHDRPSENGKIRCFLGQNRMSLSESGSGKEKSKEKSLRKPTKPPKPPKALSLDAAEQKMAREMAREMAELAIQKRLRMERMKSIRNMKKGNRGSNYSNFCSLFVTVLFCVIIIWQEMTLKGSSAVNAHASHHEPSLLHYGGQISEGN